MRYIPLLLVLLLALPGRALADGPAAPLDYTRAQTGTYQFEIIDYSSANTEDLNIDFASPSFINWTGSIGLTLITLMSENVLLSSLTILVIITLALLFMFSVIANRKIDANISDLTTDIELNQSLADLTDNVPLAVSLNDERLRLNDKLNRYRGRRVNYGGAVNDFRRLNNGRRR